MSYSAPIADVDEAMFWIDGQAEPMRQRVERWCAINSGSINRDGLEQMAAEAVGAFEPLGGRIDRLPMAGYERINQHGQVDSVVLADAVQIVKRPEASFQILLGIHLDTVFGPEHAFQKVETIDPTTLRGPGVADAKGGLVVMLTALEALERSGCAKKLGWTVLLNPDEELGSPGSAPLLQRAAANADIGLVYEPTLPDGSLIGQRKGSGNFTIVVRGRAAHVGRHFGQGRSAIFALAELIRDIGLLGEHIPGALVNAGEISGGGPVNVVADLAIGRFNIRVDTYEQQRQVQQYLQSLVRKSRLADGIELELHGGFAAPPKRLDPATECLLGQVADCGRDLGLAVQWQTSGGVCDGNRLAAAGLSTVDTLGPRGGSIHSDQEFLLLDSLVERAKLSALLLMGYANGRFTDPMSSVEPVL